MRRGIATFVARRTLPAPPVVPNGVICVGGLSIGGAGRTPVVAFLARKAQANGLRVGIAGHGYRGRQRTPAQVTAPDVARFGDEAVAMAAALPQVPIWVGGTRRQILSAMPPMDVILTDGGLLDPHLPRQQTVLVIDATASTAVLPAGPLRAPLNRVTAHWRWRHRVDEPGARAGVADVLSRFEIRAIELPGGRRVSTDWLRDRPVRLLSGIARPASFHHAIRALGAHVVETAVRADHQPFSRTDRRRLTPEWIVTAKDRVRLPPDCPVCTAHGEVVVTQGDAGVILRAVCDS